MYKDDKNDARNYFEIVFFLKQNYVRSYERYRPQILSVLAKVGGLLAIFNISFIMQLIHRKFFRNAVKKDDFCEDLTEKYSIEKMNKLF